MKYKLIAMYTKALFVVEDVIAGIEQAINGHRARVEEKYWDRIADL